MAQLDLWVRANDLQCFVNTAAIDDDNPVSSNQSVECAGDVCLLVVSNYKRGDIIDHFAARS